MFFTLKWFAVFAGITLSTERGITVNAFQLFGEDSGCGAQLTAPSGLIRSPGYPQNYPRNRLCVWKIHVANTDSIIHLKFQTFSLESHPQCRYDYILIRDGDSQLAPILGKYCGNKIPNDINSKSNKLWIRFYSDSAITRQGFAVNYAASNNSSFVGFTTSPQAEFSGSCDKILHGKSGEIESPHFRRHHTRALRCVWLIDNDDPYYVIQINFDLLHIKQNERCLFEYVLIEDVSNEDARILGRFCGSSLPAEKLAGQKLRITYKSEYTSEHRGFKLKWSKIGRSIKEVTNQACGGTKTSTIGFLRSSAFPTNYQNNLVCQWSISAPEDSMKIQLRFSNFDLERSRDCIYDKLEIHDGSSRGSPLLGRYCGHQDPGLIETTQKQMFIAFETDSSDTKSGFEALWIAVANSNYSPPPLLPRQPRGPEQCGGTLKSFNGTLTTPNYPNNYSPNTVCTWIIKADSNHQVKLAFQTFDIEKHESCLYDKLSIRDGESSKSKIITEACGDVRPGSVVSKTGSLWIRFSSDESKEMTGFSANWQFLAKSGQMGCGHVFRGESGELSSPDYPNPTKGRRFCTWTIEVPPHKRIELTFKDIDMRSSASCLYGYIQVVDGNSNDSPELGRFCRDFLPRPMLSSRNKILIGYQPDGTARSKGFKLRWRAINERRGGEKLLIPSATPCNTTLGAESGTIVLAKGTRSCKWKIQLSADIRITLSIIKANVLPNPECNLERLYVYNGYTSTAPFLMKVCGRVQASSATSFTNVLSIEYELYGESNEQEVVLQWNAVKEHVKSKPLSSVSCGVQDVPLSGNLFTLARLGMLPWMAALYSGSAVVFCAASILSSTWLVTAAHCLKRYPFYAFRKIAVGDLNVFEIEPAEQLFDIKLLLIHPGYNSSTHENDIALINIEGQIAFNEKVMPICLPESDAAIPRDTACFVAGWGAPSFLGQPANRLFAGKVPIVSAIVCNNTIAYKGRIRRGMLCAGNRDGGIDTCHGDGGGPLACKVSGGRFILSGVTSWGSGCGYSERYGVYTDVRHYIKWIRSTIVN